MTLVTARPRALVTAPLRGPGFDKLRQLADVVYDPWIEQTPLSIFVREDFYAYFVLLIFHAWGMALLVGGGIAVSLRTLGVASGARLERFVAFFPYMKAGAAMARARPGMAASKAARLEIWLMSVLLLDDRLSVPA